jgi:nitrite reductase (NADH) large subunit
MYEHAERTGIGGQFAHRRPRARAWLRGVTIATIAAVVAIVFAAPVPPARSIRGLAIAPVLSGQAFRRASGYSAAAIALAGVALLAIRRRRGASSRGDAVTRRAAHATMGALTLAALAAHTGLHLGRHLNRALMIDFLALALLGAGAAGVAALEHRSASAAARFARTAWFRAHVAAALPLPVLLALHVLCAYYYGG